MTKTITYLTSHKGRFRDLNRCIKSVYRDMKDSNIDGAHYVWLDGPLDDGDNSLVFQLEDELFPYLRIFASSFNCGKGYGMNRLMSLADSEYFSFLDSDDWILRGKTRQSLSFLETHDLDACGTSYLTGDRKCSVCDQNLYPTETLDIIANFLFFPYLLFSTLTLKSQYIYTQRLAL